MSDWYVLEDDGRTARKVSLLEGAKAFEDRAGRKVARTIVTENVDVSTVFIGLDHSFETGPHDPVLWETLVFGGIKDGEMERYTSREAAEKGHAEMVKIVRRAEGVDYDS